MKFTSAITGNQTRAFNKLKKEAKTKLDNNSIDKEELIASIRKKRKELSKKNNSYKYHDEVTEKDMIMTLANRELMKRNQEKNMNQRG